MTIVRKAKKNWIEGKKGITLGFEIQQPVEHAHKKLRRTDKKIDLNTHNKLVEIPEPLNLIYVILKKAYDQTGALIDEPLVKMTDELTEIVRQTRSLMKKKVETLPAIVPLLLSLFTACKSEDLNRYTTLIKKFAEMDDHTFGLRIKILSGLAEHAKPGQMRQLLDVQDGLEAHPTLLNAISSLFTHPPYPHLTQFVGELKKNKKDLKAYIHSFDKDPKGARAASYNEEGGLIKSAEQIINEQFDTSQLRRVITDLQNDVSEGSLTSKDQYNLTQQVTYINAIGKDYPFTVRKKIHTNLTKSSRAELRELTNALIAQLRDPALNSYDKVKARLNLLAVLREQYFRSTGEFIKTTQLVPILLSLNNQQNNKLLEIDSGERRSATIAVLAAMQWIETGHAVDVCLSTRDIVKNQYQERDAKNFFTSLGIPSAIIQAGDIGTYQNRGINYSTVADLAIYHEQNSEVPDAPDYLPTPANLIISGFNLADINERTIFSLVKNSENKDNPYAWIYPLVNEFINQEAFRNLNPEAGEVWDMDRDVLGLKAYLDNNAKTDIQKDQANHLPIEQFSTWINSACIAQQLVHGEDFIIKQSIDSTTAIAIPKYLKEAQKEFCFSKQVQQFLHARLQKEHPSVKFVIEPEGELIETVVSLGDFLNRYKKQGYITGIFNTLSEDNGFIERPGKLDVVTGYKIPAHKTDKLGRFHPTISANKFLDRIIDQVSRANKGQPIVLIAQDVHQVQRLEQEFNKQFPKKGKSITIHAFTGDESEDQRQQWIAAHAGQYDTITITTSLLIKDARFTTPHAKGFLTIQTYLDTPENVQELIERVADKGKPGDYVAFHEEQGSLFSNAWYFQSEEERAKVVAGITQTHKKNQEGRAVAQYSAFNALNFRQTVLKQFNEWQAFLQLVTPQAEWNQLKKELLDQKDDLIFSLEAQWQNCLVDFGVNVNHTNKKLHAEHINNALKAYEWDVNFLWQEKLTFFKEKGKAHIVEGSINALRYKYLTEVDLTEQLHITQLLMRQQWQAAIKERQMRTRYVDFALDVNGAMLAYTDCSPEPYKRAFAKSQLKVLGKDVIQQINLSSLNAYAKSLLIQRVNDASHFLTLELVLNHFNDLLGSQHYVEKYRMQPIISELVRAYRYAGIPETDELKKLKKSYIDNVAFEIVDHLEQSLSWAKESNQGLGYWLERAAVKTAAHELLVAINEVKNTKDSVSRQKALRQLYRLLIQQQVQLEDLWIFSFGHSNTRDLINHTLKTIESLTTIGPAPEQIDASFMQECKEEVYYEMMRKQFDTALEKVERENQFLQNNPQWIQIRKQIRAIQKDNPTVHTNNELYYFLSKTSKELIYTNSPIFKPLIELRGTVRNIADKFYQHHKNLLNESKHFALKAKKLHLELEGLAGYTVKRVTIKSSQTGFDDSFDLIIEGSGSAPLLNNFLHYNPRTIQFIQDRNDVQSRLAIIKARINELKKFQTEQAPESFNNPKDESTINLELLTASCRDIISEYFTLKGYIKAKTPTDLSRFSKQEQNYFSDRTLTSTFHCTQFTLEQIGQLKDEALKAEFIELYNKINKKPKSFFSQLMDWVPLLGTREESSEDLTYQFASLINRPGSQLDAALRPEMNKKWDAVAKILSDLQAEENALTEQILFLDDNIVKEKQQAGVISQRFKSLEKLYDFEIALRKQNAAQSVGASVAKEVDVVRVSEPVIREDYFSETQPTASIIEDDFDGTPAEALGM